MAKAKKYLKDLTFVTRHRQAVFRNLDTLRPAYQQNEIGNPLCPRRTAVRIGSSRPRTALSSRCRSPRVISADSVSPASSDSSDSKLVVISSKKNGGATRAEARRPSLRCYSEWNPSR
jgi:hypothetical protein